VHHAPQLETLQEPTRPSRLLVTLVELVGLMTFASVLVLALIGLPILAAWVQVGRFGP
jgi:hypothetical protein